MRRININLGGIITLKHYRQLERLACLCVSHGPEIAHDFFPKIAQQMDPIRTIFFLFF